MCACTDLTVPMLNVNTQGSTVLASWITKMCQLIHEGGEDPLGAVWCSAQRPQACHSFAVHIYPVIHPRERARDINFCQGRFREQILV